MNADTTLTDLVIWGASGHAMVVADIAGLQGLYRVVGFIDNVSTERYGTQFCGAPVLGGEEQLAVLRDRGIDHIVVGFGHCRARLALTDRLQSLGFTLPVLIHPRATVAGDVAPGAGTVIVAGAVINPGATIGRSVIVNTLASVGHECEVGDGAHIAPGARLAGRSTVGPAAQVGIGSSVVERVHIGAGALIGAGSAVVEDIPDNAVAYGVPARVKRMVK